MDNSGLGIGHSHLLSCRPTSIILPHIQVWKCQCLPGFPDYRLNYKSLPVLTCLSVTAGSSSSYSISGTRANIVQQTKSCIFACTTFRSVCQCQCQFICSALSQSTTDRQTDNVQTSLVVTDGLIREPLAFTLDRPIPTATVHVHASYAVLMSANSINCMFFELRRVSFQNLLPTHSSVTPQFTLLRSFAGEWWK